EHLLAVLERPVADLRLPAARVTVRAHHPVLAAQLVDRRVHLGTRDLPTPVRGIPDRRPPVRTVPGGEPPTVERLRPDRRPVVGVRTVEPEADLRPGRRLWLGHLGRLP